MTPGTQLCLWGTGRAPLRSLRVYTAPTACSSLMPQVNAVALEFIKIITGPWGLLFWGHMWFGDQRAYSEKGRRSRLDPLVAPSWPFARTEEGLAVKAQSQLCGRAASGIFLPLQALPSLAIWPMKGKPLYARAVLLRPASTFTQWEANHGWDLRQGQGWEG